LAALCQLLDGATAIQMMDSAGPLAELNPAVRLVYQYAGSAGVMLLKVVVASTVLPLLMYVGHRGRVRLATNYLVLSVGFGVLGIVSNINVG
jgi:hypothetical protein